MAESTGMSEQPQASPTQLQYQALDTNVEQIRLFTLARQSRTSRSSRMTGSLDIFDLNDCPPFLALSYTWGDIESQQAIEVDDGTLMIRENLMDFLETFMVMSSDEFEAALPHYPYATTAFNAYLWVDQLCVDQQNIAERNHQVRLMNQIYGRAEQVITWLGKDDSEIDLALRELGQAGGLSLPAFIACMEAVDSHPYWRRVWIVQEVLLAKQWVVFCGPSFLHWHDLCERITAFMHSDADVEGRAVYMTSVFMFSAFKAIWKRDRILTTWIYLVGAFCCNACADLRDKVYGFLGFLTDEECGSLQADYTKSAASVLSDCMTFVCKAQEEELSLGMRPQRLWILQRYFDKVGHEMGVNAKDVFEGTHGVGSWLEQEPADISVETSDDGN